MSSLPLSPLSNDDLSRSRSGRSGQPRDDNSLLSTLSSQSSFEGVEGDYTVPYSWSGTRTSSTIDDRRKSAGKEFGQEVTLEEEVEVEESRKYTQHAPSQLNVGTTPKSTSGSSYRVTPKASSTSRRETTPKSATTGSMNEMTPKSNAGSISLIELAVNIINSHHPKAAGAGNRYNTTPKSATVLGSTPKSRSGNVYNTTPKSATGSMMGATPKAGSANRIRNTDSTPKAGTNNRRTRSEAIPKLGSANAIPSNISTKPYHTRSEQEQNKSVSTDDEGYGPNDENYDNPFLSTPSWDIDQTFSFRKNSVKKKQQNDGGEGDIEPQRSQSSFSGLWDFISAGLSRSESMAPEDNDRGEGGSTLQVDSSEEDGPPFLTESKENDLFAMEVGLML